MTVINPSSISGITSITMPSGDGNVLTIHTNDGTERFRIDSSGNIKVGTAATISPDGDVFFTGVCTATTLTGAASGLTGALPAIDGSALTGMASTDNVRTGILDVAGISTFRNTMNVGAAVTISESGIEASGIGITCANINGTQIGGRRNLVINGAMNVAQRGTSAEVTSNDYFTIDRYTMEHNHLDENATQAQVDVSSGTSPYTEGFRKAFKLTNGNQSNGAGSTDTMRVLYRFEAQDIANSGWNYKSSSSFITLSFWVKSSVAQSFKVSLISWDGTARTYTFDTGSLTADTWTKVIKTIPGDSAIQIDNDANLGFQISFHQYLGTSYTSGSYTEESWTNFANPQTKTQTTTWYTTNDATWELTGVQLEVGPQATAFEHRSFNEELLLCQRYFQIVKGGFNVAANSNNMIFSAPLYCVMRAAPSAGKINISGSNSTFEFGDMVSIADHSTHTPTFDGGYIHQDLMVTGSIAGFDNLTAYRSYKHEPNTTNGALITADAEL